MPGSSSNAATPGLAPEPENARERQVRTLRALLDGSAGCVFIPTDDERGALELVRETVVDTRRSMLLWDVVRGVRDGMIEPSPGEQGTEHPAAALVRMSRATGATVCVMCDLAAHLDDPRTLRAAREVIARFAELESPSPTLVLIDHKEEIPAVIRASSGRFEMQPPDDIAVWQIVIDTLRRVNKSRTVTIKISARDMASVVANLRGLQRSAIERIITGCVWQDRQFCADDLKQIQARKRETIKADGLLEFVDAPTSMDQIGGLKRLKAWLTQRERALSPEAREFGIEPPRGVLMLGVQGAGKSLCAKAIATAWKRPLLRLDPSVLYDRYIGESERRLRDALKQAEAMAPVVLWIDEIEKGFASAASQSIDGGLSQRMFGTLLTWMQDHRHPVFLAATANNVEALPPELLRKGRFDEIFFVDLPSDEARRAIFAIHLKKRNRDADRFDLARLVEASKGYSGAEIEEAIKSALHEAYTLTLGTKPGRSNKDPMTTELVLRTLTGSPPLSVTMAERINALRRWAGGRCVPAE